VELREITLVLSEGWQDDRVAIDRNGRSLNRREFERWDEFMALLGAGLDVATSVRSDCPRSLDGLLMLTEELNVPRLAGASSTDPRAVYEQTLLLKTGRGVREAERLDSLHVAAALPAARYATWQADPPEEDFASGLFGRSDLAKEIGAACQESRYIVTARYCMLAAEDSYENLPELTGAYLLHYASTVL
jgi:hypothetical protein